MASSELPTAARILPDVPAIRREFDYEIPPSWMLDGRAQALSVGSMVRVGLHGRRVAGWVTELDPPDRHERLQPLAKLSGVGPSADMISLCRWAARRWLGPVSSFLGTASPPTMVSRLPRARPSRTHGTPDIESVRDAFDGSGSVVRVAPLGDRWPLVMGAIAHGNALILAPSLTQARTIVGRLRRLGVSCALHPRDWAMGAGGATVVGTRSAALAPVDGLAAILMIDEHDEAYQEERAPTWHAREVLFERAERAGVPFVLTSPMPTLEALSRLPEIVPSREAERAGWPLIRTVDPRDDSAARGTLWTADVVSMLRSTGRVVCVLNRRGRSRLMACKNCDELAICQQCDGALRQEEDLLECVEGHQRPVVCANCAATSFKNLRVGVTRAREELEALLREPVVEVTADTESRELDGARVLVGTEAVLHRVESVTAVAFVDFDQELSAPRYRAGEQALALLVRAGRLVGGRRDGTGQILIQTRQSGHPVVRAAVNADVETWTVAERTRRELLRYPPFAVLAEISGPGAAELVDRVGNPLGLEVRGPRDDRWLIRADDPEVLADAFEGVERPKARVRVAVDPLRLA